MIVRLSTATEYYSVFPAPATVFSSRAFVEANASRAQAVRHFIGYDEKDKPRLGIPLGLKGDQWKCPFSAPFGEVACNQPQSLERIYDFISELAQMLAPMPLHITLPPAFYAPEELTRATGVLANFAAKAYYDYNYHYELARFPRFEDYFDRAARKNYHRALRQPFVFEQTSDIPAAYAVIKANRASHGYPLAMSLEQVLATTSGPGAPVHANFFLLSLQGANVAAAMVYDVAPGIAQVVYWGDAPGYSEMRPMNLLPVKIFEHYYQAGYRILDIGPSSSQGIPSPGLCRFKESLGCSLTLKPTFSIL